MYKPILAGVAIAGIAIAAARLAPRPGCRNRDEGRGDSRRRAFQRAFTDVAAIRENTDRILEILEGRTAA